MVTATEKKKENPFDIATKINPFDEAEEPVYAFPRQKLPEPYDWMVKQDKLLEDVLDTKVSTEDIIPIYMKYDFGRLKKITSETFGDKLRLSIIYKSLFDIEPKITFNLTDIIDKAIVGHDLSPEAMN